MAKQKTGIRQLATEEAPRERLLLHGQSTLSNIELLAIILGSGTKDQNVLELSRSILGAADHKLQRLSQFEWGELTKLKGVGMAKALTIVACLEFAKRISNDHSSEVTVIRSSSDGHLFFSPLLKDKLFEEFWVLLLNRRNQIIKPIRISEGGVSGTLADPKKIFRAALSYTASALILCHNHPSGNRNPSKADIALTKRIASSAQELDIQLLDHLIIAGGTYYSFADEGMI